MSRHTLRVEHRLHLPQTITAGLGRRAQDADSAFGSVHGLDLWKRVADVVIATLAIILTAPVGILAAIAVKITSPGPVLFRQERVGLDRRESDRRRRNVSSLQERRSGDRRRFVKYGRPFTMFKFRTMRTDAEGDTPRWARPGDPRVTRVGRFLRRTRIDEIPQFLNVLRGDMSMVGPRPERSFFIASNDREVPDFKLRLRAKPGITGLAQVHAGYTNSVEGMKKKLAFDLEYIRHLGPATDLKILLQTIMVVVTGKGAC